MLRTSTRPLLHACEQQVSPQLVVSSYREAVLHSRWRAMSVIAYRIYLQVHHLRVPSWHDGIGNCIRSKSPECVDVVVLDVRSSWVSHGCPLNYQLRSYRGTRDSGAFLLIVAERNLIAFVTQSRITPNSLPLNHGKSCRDSYLFPHFEMLNSAMVFLTFDSGPRLALRSAPGSEVLLKNPRLCQLSKMEKLQIFW